MGVLMKNYLTFSDYSQFSGLFPDPLLFAQGELDQQAAFPWRSSASLWVCLFLLSIYAGQRLHHHAHFPPVSVPLVQPETSWGILGTGSDKVSTIWKLLIWHVQKIYILPMQMTTLNECVTRVLYFSPLWVIQFFGGDVSNGGWFTLIIHHFGLIVIKISSVACLHGDQQLKYWKYLCHAY